MVCFVAERSHQGESPGAEALQLGQEVGGGRAQGTRHQEHCLGHQVQVGAPIFWAHGYLKKLMIFLLCLEGNPSKL